jgi:5'-phosphate synthase pdxT subunit
MIGIISFQGDYEKHRDVLTRLGAEVRPVRSPDDLVGVRGLIIPGGESTTIGKLMDRFGLIAAVRDAAKDGLPILGTCAGAILLAREIESSDQVRLGVLDIAVRRNAYGRQVDSFESSLTIRSLGDQPFEGVFIRAPMITSIGPRVEVLAEFEDAPVLVRRDRIVALTFHPELTADTRIHASFLAITRAAARA